MRLVRPKTEIAITALRRDQFEVRFTPMGTKVATWRDDDNHHGLRFECWDPKIVDELFDLTEKDALTIIAVKGPIREFERKNYYGGSTKITQFLVEHWHIAR